MQKHIMDKPYFWLALFTSFLLTACDDSGKDQQKISYSKQVIPILQKHCLECHVPGEPGQQASGLDMSTHQSLMKGTRFGPVIKPGDSLSSTLVILVEGRADPSIKMPHGDRPSPSAAEIKTLRQWIDQGALNN
jgi:hypothetical protein